MFSVGTIVAPVLGLWLLDDFGGNVLWGIAGVVGVPLWVSMVLLARSLRQPAD